MGFKAILTMRRAVQSHLAEVDRDPSYADHLAEHVEQDDNFFSKSHQSLLLYNFYLIYRATKKTSVLLTMRKIVSRIFQRTNGMRNMCCHVSKENVYNAGQAATWMFEVMKSANDFQMEQSK
jgi:hypothetical protein